MSAEEAKGEGAGGARTFLSAARCEEQTALPSERVVQPSERCCGQECPRSGREWSVRLLLASAMVLALGHYAFGEWVFHPRLALWREPLFWQPMPWVAAVPVLIWVGWLVISLGRVNAGRAVLVMFAAAFAGDWGWWLVWRYAVVLGAKVSPDYWYWWTYWLPTVLVAGNGMIAREWWRQLRGGRAVRERRLLTWGQAVFRAGMVLAASGAAMFGIIHLGLPRLPVSDLTLDAANELLVPARWSGDFEFVVQSAPCRGKRLGALLEHVELANRLRGQFYTELDTTTFQQWVLSPVVDALPVAELDWRRVLWETFWPPVRQEHDPAEAARVVGRVLREHVGISPAYPYRVGVETIWTLGMTDEAGFERVYVAALRSVGIAARLDGRKRAEYLANGEWRPAPRPGAGIWSASPTSRRDEGQ